MLTAFLSQPPSTPDLKMPFPLQGKVAFGAIRKALESGAISEKLNSPKAQGSTWQTPQGVIVLTGRGDAPIKSQSVENGTVGVFKRDSGTVGVLQCVKGNWETLYTEEEARKKFSLKEETLINCWACDCSTKKDERFYLEGDYYCPECHEELTEDEEEEDGWVDGDSDEAEFICHSCGYEGPESEFSYFNDKLYCKECHDELQKERKATKPSDSKWVPLTPSNYRKGAAVRVAPSVETPSYGWGNVTHESRGTLKLAYTTMREEKEAEINFPYRKANWKGKFSELEILV